MQTGDRAQAARVRCAFAATLLCLSVASRGQDALQSVANQVQVELEEALEALAKTREAIAAEKVPLSRRLGELEELLIAARREHDESARALDARNLEAVNARSEVRARGHEVASVASLLDEYVRNFESRAHIAELQRYKPAIDAARAAAAMPGPATLSGLTEQMKVVDGAVDRIRRMAGGEMFQGAAVAPGGEVKKGTFAMVGPVAVFASEDGKVAGLVGQRPGSGEPSVADAADGAFAQPIRELLISGEGAMPMDLAMGGSFTRAEARETLADQILGGGVTLVPILVVAACALGLAMFKWLQMRRMRPVSERELEALFREVNASGVPAGIARAKSLGGDVGSMIEAALGQAGEPKELIEGIMFEKVLVARLKLQSLLPFIALCASAAPLLGLLGTITGLIDAFQGATFAGAGEATALTSGISRALVATECGLFVAVPALLAHAFLSRRAASLIQNMQRVAAAFMTRLPAGPK